MSVLSELVEALRSKNTLPWSLRHVGAEGPDAALRRAWEDERDAHVLVQLDDARDGERFAARKRWSFSLMKGCACPGPCETCCGSIREAVRCPTWSELAA